MATLSEEDIREALPRIEEMRRRLAVPQGDDATFGAHARCWLAHGAALMRVLAYLSVWPLNNRLSPRTMQLCTFLGCSLITVGAPIVYVCHGKHLSDRNIAILAVLTVLSPVLFNGLMYLAFVPFLLLADLIGFILRKAGRKGREGRNEAGNVSKGILSLFIMVELHRAKRAAGKGSDWGVEGTWNLEADGFDGRLPNSEKGEKEEEGLSSGEGSWRSPVDEGERQAMPMDRFRPGNWQSEGEGNEADRNAADGVGARPQADQGLADLYRMQSMTDRFPTFSGREKS